VLDIEAWAFSAVEVVWAKTAGFVIKKNAERKIAIKSNRTENFMSILSLNYFLRYVK